MTSAICSPKSKFYKKAVGTEALQSVDPFKGKVSGTLALPPRFPRCVQLPLREEPELGGLKGLDDAVK